MADLTRDEITLIENVIDAIISKDWTFLSQVPKDAVHNDQAFRECVDLANLTPADIPPDLRAKTLVNVTGARDDMIQVLLRNDRVFLMFLRKHKTHDLRLLALAPLDAFAGSIEQKDEGPSMATNQDGPRPEPTEAEKDATLFREASSYVHAYKINSSRTITEQQSTLTDGEAAVALGFAFIMEVSNGGISQYLTNSSGDDAELALYLFRKLGIDDAASALERAKMIMFGGRPIPTNDGERYDIVSAWEEANEPETDRIVREIQGDIGFGEQIESQLGAYVRLNPKEFPRSSH
jgi:hypothetical protein